MHEFSYSTGRLDIKLEEHNQLAAIGWLSKALHEKSHEIHLSYVDDDDENNIPIATLFNDVSHDIFEKKKPSGLTEAELDFQQSLSKIPLYAFYLSAAICLSFSTVFHMFLDHSKYA